MKATLRTDPNCCRAVVLEQSWGKLSPSLSFPQPDVPAADRCGGLCGDLASFQVRTAPLQLGEFLAPGTLRSEKESGGKCSEMRIRTPTPQVAGSHRTSWVVGGMGHGLWDQTDLPLLGWVTLGK